jgi:hypothetical protein
MELAVRAIVPGIGLAVGSLLLLGLIATISFAAAIIAFFLLHGAFVVVLSRHLLTLDAPVVDWLGMRTWVGGAALASVVLPFVWLDVLAGSYSCADGQMYGRSIVPPLPWFLIAIALLNVSGLATRLAVWRSPAKILGLPERIILTGPLMLPVWWLGTPFSRKPFDCTPPFEGWGLFEGGLVLFPLLGLFLFAASLATAVLAATFVLPPDREANRG